MSTVPAELPQLPSLLYTVSFVCCSESGPERLYVPGHFEKPRGWEWLLEGRPKGCGDCPVPACSLCEGAKAPGNVAGNARDFADRQST